MLHPTDYLGSGDFNFRNFDRAQYIKLLLQQQNARHTRPETDRLGVVATAVRLPCDIVATQFTGIVASIEVNCAFIANHINHSSSPVAMHRSIEQVSHGQILTQRAHIRCRNSLTRSRFYVRYRTDALKGIENNPIYTWVARMRLTSCGNNDSSWKSLAHCIAVIAGY